MKKSAGSALSWQLLKEVLSIYFIITLVVTVAEMGFEYLHTRNMVRDELLEVQKSFQPAIASALWELNQEQLEALQQGIVNLPIITTLRIRDAKGNVSTRSAGPDALGTNISHVFPVTYHFENEDIPLAEVTFETSADVVLERLKFGYQMILVVALFKSVVLTLLFFWAFRRRLGTPLTALTAAVSAINLDHLRRQQVQLRLGKDNELGKLESAVNQMLTRLDDERLQHFAKLEAINHDLENQIAERTRELLLTNQRLEALAHTDTLTGIANRRRLDEQVDREIRRSRRNGKPLALLMIDLDHFKQINDRYGHSFGDSVLSNFASVVPAVLRSSDLVARIGGEEFAVLLPETEPDIAIEVARRILQTVRRQVLDNNGDEVRYTVSIGVASLHNEQDYDDLLRHADAALYRAKESGRDRVCVDSREA